MQKLKINFALVAIMIGLFGSVSSFAQQAISTEKRTLILEFRKLTGAQNVNSSINLSFTGGVPEVLSSLVEQDKDLTDSQKQELRKSVAEAGSRINNVARDFLADKAQISQLSEEVIYQIYDRTFTESELKEVIAFYRTPTGQKAATFLPSLSSQVQKEFGEVIRLQLQNLIQSRSQAETDRLKQQIIDLKSKKSGV